tara:strand:- start:1255 stop:2283 length:1029 start_codon:yes stop_codon:yes gene_type:complete
LITDPKHPQIKARAWSFIPPLKTDLPNFRFDVKTRLREAFERRAILGSFNDRNNVILAFAEGDRLPGLMITALNDLVYVQFYSAFWETEMTLLERDIPKLLREVFPEKKFTGLAIQFRNLQRAKNLRVHGGKNQTTITEFGVNYGIRLHTHYDCGIYTDMSEIRASLKEYFYGKSFLNLFCYTGAYSLFALKNGATQVSSVDLSARYLDWLNHNLGLNPDLDQSKHESIEMSAEDALAKMDKTFDIILCDPPTASSDGKKVSRALDAYDKMMPAMLKRLNPGGRLIVFLNTHSVSRSQFEERILKLAPGFSVEKRLSLGNECPRLSGFPEGDYLKGLVLKQG